MVAFMESGSLKPKAPSPSSHFAAVRSRHRRKFALCAPPGLWQSWGMSTLTIELPDDLAARLEAASAQAHIAPAQLVRATLEKALPANTAEPAAGGPSLYDLMKDGLGCVKSGVPDLATNPQHMEGFGQCRK
jgi:hypothetical protein